MKTLRLTTIVIATALTACGGPSGGSTAVPASDAALTPQLNVKKFTWVSNTGAEGQKVSVRCPSGYRIVGGASSSVDGSAVGIGWGKPKANAWVVKPSSSTAQAIAIASCVSTTVPASTFVWKLHPSGGGVASVQCPSGYVLVTGFARITAKGQQITKTYVQGNDAFFVEGGAAAGASCGRGAAGITTFPKWGASQNPKEVYSPCAGGFSVIGGNTGTSSWPGPPIQQHRGNGTPGVVSSAGWWVFANGTNVVSMAVCVPNGT
jgi:hypothetical protein